MQPDDFGQRNKTCVMCGSLTSREIDGKAVCTKCFTAGWGRLPEMKLPDPEEENVPEPPPGNYYCTFCRRAHTYTSKIGKRHLKYRR